MYESPRLTEVGSVIELTLGMIQRGQGDSHSGQGQGFTSGSPGQGNPYGLS